MFWKLDLFPSWGEGEIPTLLGPLERTNLSLFYIIQWLMLALSKGPSRVGVSSLTWGWKQIQFLKRYVLWFLEYQTMDKV
jgi:hypothetical protein